MKTQRQYATEQLTKMIAAGKALKELQATSGFKILIEEMYLTDEAHRLVGLLAEPAILADKDKEKVIITDLKGISSLNQFILSIERNYEQAKEELERVQDPDFKFQDEVEDEETEDEE